MAYLMLKLPAGLAECYAVGIFWVAGLVNLTYPFWWLSFRNHSPGTRLSPVPVITPFDWFGTGGHFRVATFPGTFAAFGAGAVMLLAAPWVTRAVVAADRWLIRGLSQYIETRYAAQLLAGNPAGVGYLLKDRVADVSEFTDAVRRVAAGGTALDREVVSQLLAASRLSGDLDPLTARERDVLALMAEGRSNAGVATALVLSLGTVEKHVASIFGKLGLPASDTDNRRVLAVLRYLDS
jgi:DNA-binding CsgD family transcriptional regulator